MKLGVIGGSGLYEMAGIERKRWVTVTTPFGKPSDQFLTGRLGNKDIVFLPRHGRGHKILPSELNHRANVYGMKKLGVGWIISVTAVGSLKEGIQADRHRGDRSVFRPHQAQQGFYVFW